ncbi:uncharacterized protein LOC129905946 [Episyrphus balteatus]|uniref:uncharacterized protein LOC129905946 n=1 Tax=Episyrphus balteatus TaxID=286459 RepID=UPI0024853C5D|nr:uncharacterized protein LOC129905946 [Episyrphus balteatus]
MTEGTELVEINLNPPTTPEERSNNIIGNIRLARGANLPFIDNAVDDVVEAKNANQLQWAPKSTSEDGKPHLKYFAVGPSSYQIKCPLCGARADTETVQMSGVFGQLNSMLAVLSCCFPIFSLSFLYCCLSNQYRSKRLFCNKCGGHLSFYDRPV